MFEDIINPIEERRQKVRTRLSVIVSVLVHLVLLALLVLFQNFSTKEDVQVITVRLPDKVIEEINRMDSRQKEKFVKKQKKELAKIKKKIEKKKKKIEKSSSEKQKTTTETDTEDTTITTVVKSDNVIEDVNMTTTTTIKQDLFAQYDKKQQSDKSDQENTFFTEDSKEKEESDILDDLLAEFDSIDSVLDSIDDSSLNETKEGDKSGTHGDEGITWEEGGRARMLEKSPPLTIPDGVSEEGLKRTLVIRFLVVESGLIPFAEVVESTGNLRIDADLLEQFKSSWRFEALPGAPSAYGHITVNISY